LKSVELGSDFPAVYEETGLIPGGETAT